MRGEFLDVAGSRLYYYAAGSRGAGEPIILLHGFPTSGHLWTDVVPALPAGHRVVVLDLLGYGRSDPGAVGQLGIDAHADRLIGVIDQLGIERACLVGHGVGGGVAQSAGVRFPHRVSRLCLVDSIAFDAWPTARAMLGRFLLKYGHYVPPGWVLSTARSELMRGYLDQERGAHDADVFLRPFDGDGCLTLLRHVEAVTEAPSAASRRAQDITAPTSVVWGAEDPVLSLSYGRALAASIPGSTLHVIDGASHFTPAEAGHSVAAALGALLSRPLG